VEEVFMTRIVIVVALLLIVFGAPTLAQGKSGDHLARLRRPIRGVPKNVKIVEGKIAEIDDGKVIIENDYGARKELKLSSKTKFQLTEKKRIKLSEVKPGTFVKITFSEKDSTATKVQETPRKFREE
jgi:hypothetical protein